MLWREWSRMDAIEQMDEHAHGMMKQHPHMSQAIAKLALQFTIVNQIGITPEEAEEAMADYQIDAFDRIIASKMSGMTPEQVKKYAATLRKMYPSRKDQIDKLSIEARRAEQ
jgi:G3E family GTPase